MADAFSREMVGMIAERRARLLGEDEAADDKGLGAASDMGR